MPHPAAANVITDWDEKGIDAVVPLTRSTSPYMAQRMMGMIHVAMFDAVNSIERRYRPYLVQLPADPTTSKEAAAAAAAAAILATIDAKTATEMNAALTKYLEQIPDGSAKMEGIKLGQAIAAEVVEARANDGSEAPDDFRPKTSPGAYVSTTAMRGPTWPRVKPFAMTERSQFRPEPPISLSSEQWARDYNEIKDYGALTKAKRNAQQTETAQFWLMAGPEAYHPFACQIAQEKQMSVVESARFMALVAVALNDSLIAVLDAKYHYSFWRPVTAIRNGDIDDNPATERDPTWLPLANTPMHPEYPCAHCIQSGSVAGVVKAVLGTDEIPEVAMTSPAAPGVTHRWTNMADFTEEVANARVWAGFHYRFSTRVATDMGRRIGEYVVNTVMQPVATGSR
jgi:hypothetical protein